MVTPDRHASKRRLICLALLPLLVPVQSALASKTTLPIGSTVIPFILPPTYYQYYPIDAFYAGTVVEYSLVSNASVSTAFMTATQFQDFNDSNGPVSNSIVYQNGTASSQTLRVGVGPYYILVYAYGRTANVTLTFTVFPNNPFAFGSLYAPQPSGIASFGLTNNSGIDAPYEVKSSDVIGFARISTIEAYNSTAGSVGVYASGATLQMNSVLVVNEAGGRSQVYWCQNTPDFVTSADVVAMSDSILNFSSTGFLSNSTVTSEGGLGTVYSPGPTGSNEYYYEYEGSNSTYTLPVGIVLLINETAEPGEGVVVQYGARVLDGQAFAGWFDNVTIHDPSVQSAYFLTSGNDTTPAGTFYDTELVFAGEGNGESTNFTQMNSALGLYYANGTTSVLSPFSSYFSFGGDTSESADDLRVSYLGNGGATVAAGAPNYDYLGSASGGLTASSVESALGFPGAQGTSSTTSSSGTTTNPTSASNTSATPTGGIPEFPPALVATGGFLGVVVISYALVRRGRRGGETMDERSGDGA